jgi:hypothetical protein
MRVQDALAARFGLLAKNRERTLWIIGSNREVFDQIAPTIAAVAIRHTRLTILLSSPDDSLLPWLERTFPFYRVCPLPLATALTTRLFLLRSNIRVAAFLDPEATDRPHLLPSLSRLGISVLGLTTGEARTFSAEPGFVEACEAIIHVGEGGTAPTANPKIINEEAVKIVERIAALMARDLKAVRAETVGTPKLAEAVLGMTRSERKRSLISWRLRRYRDRNELAEALGKPQAILCLGNGPSSEDASLMTVTYDALFRVNHMWMERGILAKPDVVFTGGSPTMRKVGKAIFGVNTDDAEARLVSVRTFNPARPSTQFFRIADIAPGISAFDWGHLRPSNGACMIAAAVALQPKRLVVAGIDLFQHPLGSYPGDQLVPNAYSPGHSRETEIAFLLNQFSAYKGELILVGDILRSTWEKHKNST